LGISFAIDALLQKSAASMVGVSNFIRTFAARKILRKQQ